MSLYSSQTISGYNSSPPSDDGAAESQNQATWAGVKTKLGDPVKTLAEAINAELLADFNTNINTTRATLTFWDVTGFYAESAGTQVVNSGGWDNLHFTANEVDPATAFAADTYTAPQTGYYLFHLHCAVSTSLTTGEDFSLRVAKTGKVFGKYDKGANQSGATINSCTVIAKLTALDDVIFQLNHGHSPSVAVTTNAFVAGVRIA